MMVEQWELGCLAREFFGLERFLLWRQAAVPFLSRPLHAQVLCLFSQRPVGCGLALRLAFPAPPQASSAVGQF
jgi:hypothetical protein